MKRPTVHLHNLRPMSRRLWLRNGAVVLAFPWLEAMAPLRSATPSPSQALAPRRLMLVGRLLGTHADYFFPKDTGPQYTASRYLKLLESHRGAFTVFSGLSHLGYPNVHHTEAGLFTGAEPPRIARRDDVHNTISLDQAVAEVVGKETRLSHLAVGGVHIAPMIYNAKGTPLPIESRPEVVFRNLFVDGSPSAVTRELQRLSEGHSILDEVRQQLKSLTRTLGPGDRDRIENMTTAIRDAERDLVRSEAWCRKPKAKVERHVEDFENPTWSSGQKMRYDLAFLAFQTDSTRVATVIEVPGHAGDAPGSNLDHHDASHHGMSPRKIEELARFEEEEMRHFAELIRKLSSVSEGATTLLDNTVLLWASNLGNPSAHSSANLPVLVAGGGFRHQGHIAYDAQSNRPLSNLYLRILKQMGLESEKFGCSTGVLTDLG